MITSITSTLIREGCSITSITSYIFGSNGSITSSLLQIVLHYYTITSITSSSLLHKHFHYFPLVGKVMGSNGSITSYYVPPQLGDVQPQLFHISTAADRRTLLSMVVQMVLPVALTRGGAAMFMRSTPGCGTLGDPSLAWAASLWPKLRRSDGSPGLRLPSADGQQRRLEHDFSMVYAKYIPCIYPVYTVLL